MYFRRKILKVNEPNKMNQRNIIKRSLKKGVRHHLKRVNFLIHCENVFERILIFIMRHHLKGYNYETLFERVVKFCLQK